MSMFFPFLALALFDPPQPLMTARLESLLIWTGVFALSGGILVFHFRRHRQMERRNLSEHREAVALKVNIPQAQYPMVDPVLCIGCGSCVNACPEGGVLGLVKGKATIINGLRCVGHGRCAEACPVEAIQIGLGDVGRRSDIPQLDQHYQTNIKGLYIVGELGGLALVKNAIKQGETAVLAIASEIAPTGQSNPYDIVVVGAGPTGLSAALAAKRAGLSCLVLDQEKAGGTILQYPRKKMMLTQPVEIPLYGWLKKTTYLKEELLAIWNQIIDEQQLNLSKGEVLENVARDQELFQVQTSRGCYSARRVVLGLGRRGSPRKLGVPGEDKAKVAYQLLDATVYRNEHILVVGGGDSAVEAAVALACQQGNRVTLSYRKHKFFRIKKRNLEMLDQVVHENRLKVVFNSTVVSIKDRRVHLKAEGGAVLLENDYVFILIGGIPPFQLLKKMGIAFGGDS